MANDRADFADEVRNKAWFSSDTRMALDGKAVTVILQKQGKAEREDLSQVEVVQAGHMMEPFIARIAEDKLGYPLAKADWTGTHPSEPWNPTLITSKRSRVVTSHTKSRTIT